MSNGEKNNNHIKIQPKKFLFVSFESLSGDLAWQIKKEGHEVKVYIEAEDDKDVYDGFLDKVQNWKEHIDWADVIVFDNVGFGSVVESLRQKGKLVVGGSKYTDMLEEDREFGQNEMKKAGMLTLSHWDFSSFDDAIDFIKSNPGRYVFKPFAAAPNQKGILFVGQEEDGKDLIEILEQNKIIWAKKIKRFQLQKRAVGVEIAVGAFFNGKDFIFPVNINFEHKKLFPGDLGPNVGEMGTLMYWSPPNEIFTSTLLKMKDQLFKCGYVGYIDINCIANAKGIYPLEFTCFDRETEVLTENGWKNYSGISKNDKVLSINPLTKEIGWKKIVNKFVTDYDGDMINIGSKGSHTAIDVLVTPEHKMIMKKRDNKLRFMRADSILANSKIIRTGNWNGEELEHISVPEYVENHYLGKHKKYMKIIHPEKKIKSEVFLKFLGLFLAEGSISREYHITIAQSSKNKNRKEIEETLDKLNFTYTIQKRGDYQISSVQLVNFIKEIGLLGKKCNEKFIPEKFRNLSVRLLENLLNGFALGDGTIHKRTNQLSIFTTSKKLADDFQEIIHKIGWTANIRESRQKGTKSIGNYTRKNNIYFLSLRKIKTDYLVDKRVTRKEHYEGKIWDIEVEDWHTLFVRRKGKAFFSGNCRYGYPTISIQMEGILTEMGEFTYKLASHEYFELKTKKGFQVGACVVVPPFPYEDKNETFIYKDLSILFKKPSLDGIHLGDVKKIDDVWTIAGKTGYALIVTGSGPTVDDARKQANLRVNNITLQNMYYRVDIGVRWHKDSDKLHIWGYLH